MVVEDEAQASLPLQSFRSMALNIHFLSISCPHLHNPSLSLAYKPSYLPMTYVKSQDGCLEHVTHPKKEGHLGLCRILGHKYHRMGHADTSKILI